MATKTERQQHSPLRKNPTMLGSPPPQPTAYMHRCGMLLLILIMLNLCESSWCLSHPMVRMMVQDVQLNKPKFIPSFISSPSSLPLEKRASQRMQYSFGLGKRNQLPITETTEIFELPSGPIASSSRSDLIYIIYPVNANTDLMTNYNPLVTVEDSLDSPATFTTPFAPSLPPSVVATFLESKRTRPQRFSFGLGKRSKGQVIFNDLDGKTDVLMKPIASSGSNNSIDKRKMQPYGFGLGKRQELKQQANDEKSQKIKKLTNFEDFIKRRYSFGLGKRSV